ncbi:MAG TPA: VWA domain-containing protein [Thermoanaerobaculia bacterium]|nr:VWA domain-containing protein [Thermoanaerobaculia bacterium]
MRRRSSALLAAAFAAAALPALVRPAAAQEDRFREETSVVVVELPVQVVKDGQPVRGLTAANFEVWDGKVKRPLAGFEVVDLGAAAGAPGSRPAPVPPAARRNFLLLFDLAFSSHRSLERAEQAARDLLAGGLHPQDLVGVALFTAERGVVLPVGFTSDRRQVERVLDAIAALFRRDAGAAARLKAEAAEQGARDPLGLTAPDVRTVISGIGKLAGVEISVAGEALSWVSDATSGRGAGLLLATLAGMDAIHTPFITESRRSQARGLTDNLTDIARATRDVEGRKTLIFFSDGLDDALMLGDEARNQVGGVSHGQLLGNTQLLNDLFMMLEEFRRGGWVVHTVEAFGLSGNWDETGIGAEALAYMANETGGTFFNQTNQLGEAMGRVLEASRVAYVLSFQADDVPPDGAFHKVRVELVGAPRGARLTHRAGYYAPLPAERRSVGERRFRAAELVLAGEPHADIPLAVLATPFAGTAERGYVPVVVELPAAAIAAERGGGAGAPLDLELYAYAFDREGRVQDFFAQQLQLDAERGAAAAANGLRFVGDLELPAGEHELRLLVRGAASGRTTLEIVPLTVPSPDRVAKRLLPPFFVAGDGGMLTVREAGAEASAGASPFQLGEQPFVPTPHPALAPDGETRLLLAAYHLAAGELRVRGQVLTADGRPVAGGAVAGIGRIKGEGGLDRVLATFRPQGLPPGDYRLQVTLVEPQGGALSASAPFRVGGPS